VWTDATEAGPTQASTPWVAAGSIPALLRNGFELHQQLLLQGSSLGYGSKKPPSVCHLDKGGYTYIVLELIRLQAAESTNIMWCLKKSIPKMGNCMYSRQQEDPLKGGAAELHCQLLLPQAVGFAAILGLMDLFLREAV
jgi:hypothetical protein